MAKLRKLNQQEVAAWTENEAMQFGRDHAAGKLKEHDKGEALEMADFPSANLFYAYEAGFVGKHSPAAAGAAGLPAGVLEAVQGATKAAETAATAATAAAKAAEAAAASVEK